MYSAVYNLLKFIVENARINACTSWITTTTSSNIYMTLASIHLTSNDGGPQK